MSSKGICSGIWRIRMRILRNKIVWVTVLYTPTRQPGTGSSA